MIVISILLIYLFFKDNFIESVFYNEKTMFIGKWLVSLRGNILEIFK